MLCLNLNVLKHNIGRNDGAFKDVSGYHSVFKKNKNTSKSGPVAQLFLIATLIGTLLRGVVLVAFFSVKKDHKRPTYD